ncbi:MAG: hypothetical protein KKB31_01315, partial [Nanoarchaeota archaeon]|nr:hypothetical protein [Nanoarchaeota archaeon]
MLQRLRIEPRGSQGHFRDMLNQIDQLLTGTDYFWCETHLCTMSKLACIKRQKTKHTAAGYFRKNYVYP